MSSNPFSTRFVQPGAMTYEFFGRASAEELAHRFLSLRSKRGMIVGPHGSGKSTLVAAFVDALKLIVPDKQVYQLRLSSQDRKATRELMAAFRRWTCETIAIIDGYEQLSPWNRARLEWIRRGKSIPLLATMHQPLRGFETLWQTSIDNHSAEWVVHQLLEGQGLNEMVPMLLQSNHWKQSRLRNGSNLRETLFDMYDWWQHNTART